MTSIAGTKTRCSKFYTGNPVHAFHGKVDRSPLEMIDKDLEDDSHPMAPGIIPIGCLREVFSKCEFSAR